jgi:hypothetical protein
MKHVLFSTLSLIAAPALAAPSFLPVAANSDVPYTALGVVLDSTVPPFHPHSEAFVARVLVVAGLNACEAGSAQRILSSHQDTQSRRSVLNVEVSAVEESVCTEAFQPVYEEVTAHVMRWKDEPIQFNTNTQNFGELKMLKNDDAVLVASDSLRFLKTSELGSEGSAWRLAELSVAAFAGNNPCEANGVMLKPYSYVVDGVLRVGVEQSAVESFQICPTYVSPVFKTIKVLAPFPVGEVAQIAVENAGGMGRLQTYSLPSQIK